MASRRSPVGERLGTRGDVFGDSLFGTKRITEYTRVFEKERGVRELHQHWQQSTTRTVSTASPSQALHGWQPHHHLSLTAVLDAQKHPSQDCGSGRSQDSRPFPARSEASAIESCS